MSGPAQLRSVFGSPNTNLVPKPHFCIPLPISSMVRSRIIITTPPLTNFCRLGVKTRIFHLGDYRRATLPPGAEIPDDYFFINASAKSVVLRQKILKKCREDIYAWLNHENGQVAIYDAVNPLSNGRRSLEKEFAKHDVQVCKLINAFGNSH